MTRGAAGSGWPFYWIVSVMADVLNDQQLFFSNDANISFFFIISAKTG